MLLFVSLLIVSLILTAICAGLLSAASPTEVGKPSLKAELEARPSQFFGGDIAPAADPHTIPAALLLSQIERHVRLEQAAAERFVNLPTLESLHARTESTFVN